MEIHLLPDRTSFVQLGIFLSVLVALKYLLFNPLIKIITARRAGTEKCLEEAKALEERIRAASLEYNEGIAKAKEDASKEAEKIRTAALKEEALIKAGAREDSSRIIDEARSKIDAARSKAMEDLKKDIPVIADEILKKTNGTLI